MYVVRTANPKFGHFGSTGKEMSSIFDPYKLPSKITGCDYSLLISVGEANLKI